MRGHRASFFFNISSQKILSLTNKLICLRNANNLLTANLEHLGSVMSPKHLSLYSVMAFTNTSTSSKEASWIYWANTMIVLQQSTQSTQWSPVEFPLLSNKNSEKHSLADYSQEMIKVWGLYILQFLDNSIASSEFYE